MKIVKKSSCRSFVLRDLKGGDTFRLPAGESIYMKLWDASSPSTDVQVAKLDDGTVYKYCYSKQIVPVEATVTVE